MKEMPLTFDFEGKGVLDLELLVKNKSFFTNTTPFNKACFFNGSAGFVEPTSVLDSSRFSRSSSLGGGGGGSGSGGGGGSAASSDTAVVSDNAVGGGGGGADSDHLVSPIPADIVEDWDRVLSENVTGESWVMGGGYGGFELINGGFGVSDPGFGGGGGGEQFSGNFVNPTIVPNLVVNDNCFNVNPTLSQNGNCTMYANNCEAEMKPQQVFSPQMLMNQHQVHQAQNPLLFLPQQQVQGNYPFVAPPPAKRRNTGQDLYMGRQQMLPSYVQQGPVGAGGHKPKMEGWDGFGGCGRQGIIDHLHKAAEVIQTGNTLLAQEILARLNHQVSPIGNPFQRAAFYCKEALEMLIHSSNSGSSSSFNPSSGGASPFGLVFKIGAFKSFTEVSPFVQFANLTCTQMFLEAFEGFDRIHVVDFDIGYGGQWASLMQELALRNPGAPSLKITAVASPASHDHLELGLARENLFQFARETNIAFEFDVMNVDYLDSGSCSLPFQLSENEVVGVNLPVGALTTYQALVPSVFRFLKQLSPRIVISIDRGCDRTDLPFSNHVIQALQSHSNLIESLDAVNMNMEALQKIERFFLQPAIEKIVMGRSRCPEKTQHWRTMFQSSGFSPVTFSNFTESQADCVVKRTPIGGFQVEKRQSSLVLCWQQKELVSVSAWRC